MRSFLLLFYALEIFAANFHQELTKSIPIDEIRSISKKSLALVPQHLRSHPGIQFWKGVLSTVHIENGNISASVPVTEDVKETIKFIRMTTSRFSNGNEKSQSWIINTTKTFGESLNANQPIDYFTFVKLSLYFAREAERNITPSFSPQDPILGTESRSDEFLNQLARERVQRLPTYVEWFTSSPLGFKDINNLFPFPVFPVGLTDKALLVDGNKYYPFQFLLHDLAHATDMIKSWKIHPELSTGFRDLEQAIKRRLATDEVYRETAAKLSGRENAILNAIWFELFHERYLNFYLEPLKRYDSPLHERVFAEDLQRRLANKRDFGQAFKVPPSKDEIAQVIKQIQSNLPTSCSKPLRKLTLRQNRAAQ